MLRKISKVGFQDFTRQSSRGKIYKPEYFIHFIKDYRAIKIIKWLHEQKAIVTYSETR